MVNEQTTALPLIGVGLRHVHYREALASSFQLDFVEIHAENFFAEGGITQQLLEDITAKYNVSLHATSMGLGSVQEAPSEHLEKLEALVHKINPILLSDHASFSWGQINNIAVHAGDLLPVPFNEEALSIMAKNVTRAQHYFKRHVLVENLSAYVTPPGSTMSETAFLIKLCKMTECRLLLDLNNLMVNAINQDENDAVSSVKQWIDQLPDNIVGEIHLAGCSDIGEFGVMIDDHSKPVSDDVWQLYQYALERFGPVPTLIEWDLDLPSWDVLCNQAELARNIAKKVFHHA